MEVDEPPEENADWNFDDICQYYRTTATEREVKFTLNTENEPFQIFNTLNQHDLLWNFKMNLESDFLNFQKIRQMFSYLYLYLNFFPEGYAPDGQLPQIEIVMTKQEKLNMDEAVKKDILRYYCGLAMKDLFPYPFPHYLWNDVLVAFSETQKEDITDMIACYKKMKTATEDDSRGRWYRGEFRNVMQNTSKQYNLNEEYGKKLWEFVRVIFSSIDDLMPQYVPRHISVTRENMLVTGASTRPAETHFPMITDPVQPYYWNGQHNLPTQANIASANDPRRTTPAPSNRAAAPGAAQSAGVTNGPSASQVRQLLNLHHSALVPTKKIVTLLSAMFMLAVQRKDLFNFHSELIECQFHNITNFLRKWHVFVTRNQLHVPIVLFTSFLNGDMKFDKTSMKDKSYTQSAHVTLPHSNPFNYQFEHQISLTHSVFVPPPRVVILDYITKNMHRGMRHTGKINNIDIIPGKLNIPLSTINQAFLYAELVGSDIHKNRHLFANMQCG